MTSPWLLVAGDIAALVAFGLIGLASHEEAVSTEIVARSVVPFVVAWLVIGGIAGMFGSEARAGNFDPARYRSQAVRWELWGAAALLTPLAGLALMVLKPAL